jgi:hypothetical protein
MGKAAWMKALVVVVEFERWHVRSTGGDKNSSIIQERMGRSGRSFSSHM